MLFRNPVFRFKNFLSPAVPAVLIAVMAGLPADLVAQQSKVEIGDVKIQAQKTPKIDADYVTDKKWTPREWMEMEVSFQAEHADRDVAYIDQLLFKYYVILKAKDRENTRTLTADVTHVNVPVGETSHSVVYLSPATVSKITGKKGFSDSDVQFWGVEIFHQGQLVGGESSGNGKWWSSPQAPQRQEGLVLNKKQTPFAPLWGDYHADVLESR